MTETEKAKKFAETAKKLDKAKGELKDDQGRLEKVTKHGGDVSSRALDVKYSAKKVESLQRELDRLK